MQIFQALLIALWAGLCAWDQFGPHLGFRKPLLASVGVGIILGDMTTAIMIGATMEMMWLGDSPASRQARRESSMGRTRA